jgi:hypothetical protein
MTEHVSPLRQRMIDDMKIRNRHSSSHGIAETSILCDVSKMALLSDIPAR